ncbi:helix-loop-helix DNA-binding domain-containing transcription factor [Phycomyces blakesleeanus]|uniref:Helix-loop-helix DNA-binding domain-containing transcription factor n=2 Tax=Phycomyces blakesleeanus TaxID=4837 RepID=A0A167QVN6_PHYB8|nr:helix-loop-helix DNA-binding domain-containing transcription factor [Phycomyces blakesleeanus NRRL 1555(-)]OAD80350.1 helix-loop-helix DNA-binding domain-containing transcription factor [Phycomyces blakesleeanus NRRL 1555(-)]|eukprot:XP_018298390.1 helix-loop-helix DNA-binding domain-containing transcription factor [Phycomyces blakesleeanus NRRL 1555(-)]
MAPPHTILPKEPSNLPRRASYPIQDRIRIYSPATMARQLNKQKHQSKLIVHGVNILNKISLDSDIAMDRIQHRRETHNLVERRRRDKLNTLVNELTQVIPPSEAVSEKWHRAKTLRQAIDYIKSLQMENNGLRTQLGLPNIVLPARSSSSRAEIPSGSGSGESSNESDVPDVSESTPCFS